MRFSPARDLDPNSCTHLIYAFATLDPHYYVIIPQDDEYDITKGGYRLLLGMKQANPDLKVMISIGGWVEGTRKFSQMAGSAYNRREFIRSVIQFLDRHGFDGLDLDWEYPGAADLGGRPTDKEHFALLVEELSEVFAARGWLLTASVSPSRFRLEDGYDVPRLLKHLDFVNLMAFDLHAERDSSADHHAPLVPRRHDTGLNVFYNVDYAVRYWMKKGAPREKIVVGTPFYGRTFTLLNASLSRPNAPVKGFGREGRYTQEQGFLAYFEILELLEDPRWKEFADDADSPYIVNGDQWVGYDNPRSIATKMSYIRKNQLGGAMIWATDLDDFHGVYGDKWPLLSVVRKSLLGGLKAPPETSAPAPVLLQPPVAGTPVAVEQDHPNCTGQGFARDPRDCAVYYLCEWSMKHTYVCPEGLHYHAELRMCDWPELAGCPLLSSAAQPAGSTTPAAPVPRPFTCPSPGGMFEDPGDCRSYFVCDQGRAYKYVCAAEQWFNPQTGLCHFGPSERCRPKGVLQRQYFEDELIGEEDYKVVCYFTNWAWYRKGAGKFVPEHVDPRLCTHVVYAYAALDPNDLVVKPFDPWADIDNNFYQRVTGSGRPGGGGAKVLLALGGWTDSSGDKYSRLVGDGTSRRKFVTTTVAFLRRHSFAGLHLDWTYPGCWQSNCAKGSASDRPNFTKLLQELRREFQRNNPPLVLAASISGYKEIIDEAYDMPNVGREVDFMSVMAYDYHGSWEKKTGHSSPLYYRQGDDLPHFNTNFTMEYLVSKGAPRKKLLVGVPFYGQTFTLASARAHDQGAPALGAGSPGEYTKQPGMLAYYEICDRLKSKRWMAERDRYGATGPYAHFGDQWVGYEDVESIKEKARFIKNMGYGGATAWTIDLDDFSNQCCQEPYPLLRTLNRMLGRLQESAPVTGDCTRPPDPVTPSPPVMTTGSDSGVQPTTPAHEHEHEHEHPTTPRPTTQRPTTTSTRPPPTTTEPWWRPTTSTEPPKTTTSTRPPPTTTEPWWRPTTSTEPPTTTTRPWWQPSPTTEATTSTTEATTTSPRPPPGPAPTPPAGPCPPGTYHPDPDNCSAYYRCILGELRREFCAGGLHWNAQSNVCDWPDAANCGSQPATSPTEGTTAPTSGPWWSTTSQATTGGWWTSSRPTTAATPPPNDWWTERPTEETTSRRPDDWWTPAPSTEAPAEEQPDCTSGQYYPDGQSCNGFFVCVNHRLVRQTCAPGLVWNQDQYMCDWSFNVKCDAQVRAQPVFLSKADTSCQSGSYEYYQGDCNRYLMCLFGRYKEFSCASGLHWNNREHICDWPDSARCPDMGGDAGGEWGMSSTPPPALAPSTRPTTTTTTTTTSVATRPPPGEELSGYFKVVCYFTNWAWYRPGEGKYYPEDIDESLCTHIVYGFAVLDYENLIVKAHDSWADFDNKFYERVVAYKKKGVKVSLALGGWNDSAGDKYSRLVNSPSARRRFVKQVLEFLDKYGFDGLDLDWEYPKCWQVDCDKGPESDKQAFAALVRELRQAFQPRGLLLSSAVSPSKTVIDAGYDVKALGENLDWVAVMTYDFHGQWDKKTGHVAPLYFHEDDDFYFFNANYSVNYWISEGVPRRKIVMGMPMYGQSFTLAQASTNGLNARAPGPGQAGEFTRAPGFLAYYEICEKVKNRGWKVVKDPQSRMGPYAFKGNQWVSFDDVDMIRKKSEYIRAMDLGGGMIWALDLDDFRNRCGDGHHPLLNTIRSVLARPYQGDQDTDMRPPMRPTKPPMRPTKPPKPPMRPTKPSPPDSTPDSSLDLSTTPSVTTTKRPFEPASTDGDFKVICYFTNWAWYRQGGGKYLPEDIDPDLCTHIIYGFAVMNGDQLLIRPHDTWADYDNKFYERVTAFRAKGLKVLLAIGGWNDSAGDKYSRLVNSPAARARFVTHVLDFIEQHGFDGLDLDWEYPKCWQVDCKKGPDSDKQGFAALVKELKEAFRPKGLLLSSAVSPSRSVINAGYDVPVLSQYLDWISVMTYDFHGQWDKQTGHVAPMYPHPDDTDVTFNANYSIHYWIQQGADRKKLVMGMPMYGQSFSLADTSDQGLNAPTYGGGEAGEATRARGFLAYYEICTNIQRKGWHVVKDGKGRMGPYAYLRDQWVSFDDTAMIRHKSEYVRAMGLGGGMIWALDLDDFQNKCGCEQYPLLRTINRVLRGYPGPGPRCDIPADGPKQEPVDESSEAGSASSMTEEPGSPEMPDSVSTVAMEAPDCSRGVFMSHPSDCGKYFLCQYGQPLEQRCPEGLLWNMDHCDWPENTVCGTGAEGGPSPGSTTTEPPHSSTSWVEATTATVTTTTTRRPSTPGTATQDTGYKVVCYFTNWAWYRQGIGKYLPDDIDDTLCTHIAYGFAVLDGTSLTIKPHDSWADIDNSFYKKVVDLKRKGLKVVIAIGGWNDSLGDKYSRLVNSPAARRKFVDHVVQFIEQHGFDGLDLDWEYPKCWQVDCNKGPESDKEGFAALVRELSSAFKPRGLLLSSAVSPSKVVIDQGYDVPVLSQYFDWISVMTYDFHGHWDKQTGHVAPLDYYPGDTYDYFNANFSINYWIQQGADRKKLVMGMPMYGQSFSLKDAGEHGLNAKSYGPGEAGEFTRAGGFLAYYEICHSVKNQGWTTVRDPEGRIGPYAYKGTQWVSYDDVSDIRRKARFVRSAGLGGGMIWALDLDDFRDRCGCGRHPLLKTLNHELRGLHARTSDCT
ncbi:probable chitinase 10 [Bacillus rossius redtenbacheri]|uniref:probable chitinase 10 n=1 Tax=Bacillus rossius redtenbacheri TaxID=93214 RepID=UPI002FDDC469